MNDLELTRYARHIMLDEWGFEAQKNLASAHALVVGIGGLGCAVLPYLAAAGLGLITIIDDDIINLNNLQRQTLFNTEDIGQFKVLVAKQRLLKLNPNITVNAIPHKANATFLKNISKDKKITLIMDCTDNFVTRHEINIACVRQKIALISGAVMRFAGQVMMFDANIDSSPCYACVFPREKVISEESCALMGVFSPMVALIGAMQVTQALKFLSNMSAGASLLGKLLCFNAFDTSLSHINLIKDRSCKVCSEHYM